MKLPRGGPVLGLLLCFTALTPARAQTNDSFAGRLALHGTATAAVSNNGRATREAGEPNHASAGGSRSLVDLDRARHGVGQL